MDTLTCANCGFWSSKDLPGRFYGDCALGVYYGQPTFDYQGCAYHSERDVVPEAEQQIAMQSQARGGPPWPNVGRAQWVKP